MTAWNKGKSSWAKGRHFSAIHKARISQALRGRNNGMWKDDVKCVKYLHDYLTRNWPGGKPKECSTCGRHVRLDLSNISDTFNPQTYTRDFRNWIWRCRKCHLDSDRRVYRRKRNYLSGQNSPMYGRTGNKNPFFGRKHSKETREKMRLAWKKRRGYNDTMNTLNGGAPN